MQKPNYPGQQLADLPDEFVQETVQSLKQLNDLGRPETDAEVQERINQYFQFCQDTGNRPGIESLCLALHISRTTLFNWVRGYGCSPERKQIAERAKSFVGAFLEQSVLRGKISPPSGIFIMKNWLGYKDTISLEETAITKEDPCRPSRSSEDIKAEFAKLLPENWENEEMEKPIL